MMNFPFLELFLGIFGFGFSIIFCTTFCRWCLRLREEQVRWDGVPRDEQDAHRRPIYVIPFPRNISRRDSDDRRTPEFLNELYRPPRYSTTAPSGLPPSYHELEFKPDDSPPPYTELDLPALSPPPFPLPPTPPPLPCTDAEQSLTQTVP